MSEAISPVSPVSPVMSVVRENFEQLLAVLEDFERVLVERAGDGPAGPNYDPELLTVGYDVLDKVQGLRAALGLPEVEKAAPESPAAEKSCPDVSRDPAHPS